MSSIISLAFPYKGEDHYVLVTRKEVINKTFYKITVMNNSLEQIMSDANIVYEEGGRLLLDDCQGRSQTLQIKKAIVEALADYLDKEITYLFEQDNW